jgi:hypothetical protein
MGGIPSPTRAGAISHPAVPGSSFATSVPGLIVDHCATFMMQIFLDEPTSGLDRQDAFSHPVFANLVGAACIGLRLTHRACTRAKMNPRLYSKALDKGITTTLPCAFLKVHFERIYCPQCIEDIFRAARSITVMVVAKRH